MSFSFRPSRDICWWFGELFQSRWSWRGDRSRCGVVYDQECWVGMHLFSSCWMCWWVEWGFDRVHPTPNKLSFTLFPSSTLIYMVIDELLSLYCIVLYSFHFLFVNSSLSLFFTNTSIYKITQPYWLPSGTPDSNIAAEELSTPPSTSLFACR